MNKPYIICHMMTSVDGRIDCKMTENLPGVNNYYSTLDSFNAPSRVSGRVTAELEMSLPGRFNSTTNTPINEESFYKVKDSTGYEIIIDTNGCLLWNDQLNEEYPILVVSSEKVSKEYLSYLERKHISWISCGKNQVNLKRVCEILYKDFNIRRMVVVGGGHINASFLEQGLLDEISILIGAGIDGRNNMCSVFDGLKSNQPVTKLKLKSVKQFDSGAVWITYTLK